MRNQFNNVATFEGSEKWEISIGRENSISNKSDDIRNEFSRDYNRILHSNAFRRLKHKTQVFFGTKNDHICTRIEHVHHVVSISQTICRELGLNSDLASAISIGHDIGHPPFGHEGERIISDIALKSGLNKFWHEQNSLKVADYIVTLESQDGIKRNLNLTYAVRDGLISHCGEVDENGIKPRKDNFDLNLISQPNQYQPYTWEAAVVKISDKIAYMGRDIEDALRLQILDKQQLNELKLTLSQSLGYNFEKVNTTNLIHNMIMNLVENSNPENGLNFSDDYFKLMNAVKSYNYQHIYRHKRLSHYQKYARLILTSLYEVLFSVYSDEKLDFSEIERFYPDVKNSFNKWLIKYSDLDLKLRDELAYGNKVVYSIKDENSFKEAVLMYISLMSDQYALSQFEQIVSF